MACTNPLNVYRGSNSVRNYFDPDSSPPLPLVEIPDCLNPYRQDGVRVYAKMMTMHPANNVKSMPALNLLENSVVPGKTKSVVEYSSGSTVLSMSMIARAYYGLPSIQAFLSNKTSLAKLRLMQFFGINITLFGGPSQPEPTDERGGIRAAQDLAEGSDSVVNPNQYENDYNWKAHIKWTGPQIHTQLPEINLICAGMGTSGTMTGLGTYFKDAKPSVFRLGVCTAAGDRVPGPRSYALLGPVEFPWKAAVNQIEEVGSHDSFSWSIELCRQGLVCGPSSGFNLKGLYQFIEKRKAAGTLKDLAGSDGEIHCVFLCCDLPYQYINDYFDKLGEGYFPAMKNEQLLDVDLYRYDEKWERAPSDVLPEFFHYTSKTDAVNHLQSLETIILSKDDTAVIDLRQASDFSDFSLPGSLNIPLVLKETSSPFSDPSTLRSLWTRLEETFKDPSNQVTTLLGKERVLVVCYDGDSSRVATSVLRAKGCMADSVRGGFRALNDIRRDSGCVLDAGDEEGNLASWMKIVSRESLGVAQVQSI